MILRREPRIPMTDPDCLAKLLQELLKQEDAIDRSKEHVYGIHLDARNRVTLVEVITIGTLNASLIHPRETFRRAVQEATSSLIIAHNHPSGEIDPSDADIETSTRLTEAGKILGIPVIDHIIFSESNHYSMKREGLL